MKFDRTQPISRRAFLVGSCMAGLFPWKATAQVDAYEVKVKMLKHFLTLVYWPPKSLVDDKFIVGIVGKDPFGDRINFLVKNPVDGRKVEILYFKESDGIEACNLVFISAEERFRTRLYLRKIERKPIITVSEEESFLKQGGLINFKLVDNRVRFQLNLSSAKNTGLKFKSMLIKSSIKPSL